MPTTLFNVEPCILTNWILDMLFPKYLRLNRIVLKRISLSNRHFSTLEITEPFFVVNPYGVYVP